MEVDTALRNHTDVMGQAEQRCGEWAVFAKSHGSRKRVLPGWRGERDYHSILRKREKGMSYILLLGVPNHC